MSGKLSLLILEDSDTDARLLVRKLTKEGGFDANFDRVESLPAFQRALEKGRWDLIISDHSMPQFSALDALQELRRRSLDIPLIIVSGTIHSADAIAAMKSGASDFIMKDDLTRLIPAIERELRESRSRIEKRAAEVRLQQSQKMDSIGKLAGGIAHDFNNILTAINGYSHFLLNALPPGDPRRADVEEIRKAGERAAALTRQLLAFSRQQVLRPKVLNLNVLVAEIESMLRRIIGENTALSSSLARDLGMINADPGQIEQVVLNLVVNARDAMPLGGKITIETANARLDDEFVRTHPGARAGEHVMLAVGDNGTGMDEATVARLFEPFFTTKEAGKGTGLGLSTVYGIVRQSGASIAVESKLGFGSVFRIYLPRASSAVAESEPERGAAGPSRGSETILLVEDDEPVRKLNVRLLSQFGYRVLEAPTAEAALQLSKEHAGPIHLMLTDLVLPWMRGDDLAKELSGSRPQMKIIFTSGYTEAGVVKHEQLAAGALFIQKPVDPPELARLLRELLDEPGSKRA